MADLIPYLPESRQAGILLEVVDAANAINPPYLRGFWMIQMAVLFNRPQCDELLHNGLAVLRELPVGAGLMPKLARKIARIAAYLPQRLPLDVAAITYAIFTVDDRDRTEKIAKAARYLRFIPNKLIMETIAALRTLPGGYNPTEMLGPLAVHLPPPLRERALSEALTTARQTRIARRRVIQQAALLRTGAPTIPDIALLRRCVDTLDLDDCLSVLAAAVPTIHQATGDGTLYAILRSVRTVEWWWYPTLHRSDTNVSGTRPGDISTA